MLNENVACKKKKKFEVRNELCEVCSVLFLRFRLDHKKKNGFYSVEHVRNFNSDYIRKKSEN